MQTYGQAMQRHARAELRAWYLGSLRPKLARAANAGAVPQDRALALDRELRDLFDLPSGAGKQAA